ncbi:MAG: hypothetical protein KBS81_06325 [Spirochaetales bacterium]|nr:hypothetical protein [Candidatus Physcosoma equi]
MENSAGEYVWQSVNSISINELNESKEAVKEFYLFFGMDTKKSITVKLFANPLRTSNRNAEITYTLSFTEYHSKNSKDHEPFITSKDVNVLPLALSVDRDESQVTIIEKHKGNDDTQSILQGYYKVKLVTENLSVKPRVAYSGNIALRFEIND